MEPTKEDPGRHHLDAGLGPDYSLATHRVTDLFSEACAQEGGKPAGGGAHRDAARLGDEHPSGSRRGEQEGQEGGLAGARGSAEDEGLARADGIAKAGECVDDRERGRGGEDVVEAVHLFSMTGAEGGGVTRSGQYPGARSTPERVLSRGGQYSGAGA